MDRQHTPTGRNREEAVAVRDKLYFLLGGYRLDQKHEFIALLEDAGLRYRVIEGAGHRVNHGSRIPRSQEGLPGAM